MLNVLLKKATGYTVEEVTDEYGFDEDGTSRPLKKKVQTKHIPPDLAAIKAYMEYRDGGLTRMSEQQLIKEKRRLLSELAELQGREKGKAVSGGGVKKSKTNRPSPQKTLTPKQ